MVWVAFDLSPRSRESTKLQTAPYALNILVTKPHRSVIRASDDGGLTSFCR